MYKFVRLTMILLLFNPMINLQSKDSPFAKNETSFPVAKKNDQNTHSLLNSTEKVSSLSLKSEEPLSAELAFTLSATHETDKINIHFKIADGYYLYKSSLSVQSNMDSIDRALSLPKGEIQFDSGLSKNVEVYRSTLNISLTKPSAALGNSYWVDVYSQGCADIGICYPPQRQRLTFSNGSSTALLSFVDLTVNSGSDIAQAKSDQIKDKNVSEKSVLIKSDSANLNTNNLLVLMLSFIGLGLMLSFTPCVLPMIPIVSAVILGKNLGKVNTDEKSQLQLLQSFKLSLAFVFGMCITYTSIGVIAGLAGGGLIAFLQQPVLLCLFAGLMLFLAGAQFGWYVLSLPTSWLTALGQRSNFAPQNYVGVIFMGGLSACMVGPCVTAPLVGALTYIAQTGDAWTGGAALFSLSFGMGIPLIVLGAGGAKYLPKTGPWMDQVTYGFGVMLLCNAIWTIQSLLPSWLLTLCWLGILVLLAEMFGAFRDSVTLVNRFQRISKIIGLLCMAWAVVVLWGMASGRYDVLQPLTASSLSNNDQRKLGVKTSFITIASQDLDQKLIEPGAGKPVLLDIYADWCVSCIEMERFTFQDPNVAKLLESFTLLRVDVTHNTSNDQALLKKRLIFGAPSIVFYSPQGQEIQGTRLVGFQSAESFSKHLERILALNS